MISVPEQGKDSNAGNHEIPDTLLSLRFRFHLLQSTLNSLTKFTSCLQRMYKH